MKDFAFVSPQKYPGDLLAGKVIRDFGAQLVCRRYKLSWDAPCWGTAKYFKIV